jgi:hypothetical protein
MQFSAENGKPNQNHKIHPSADKIPGCHDEYTQKNKLG